MSRKSVTRITVSLEMELPVGKAPPWALEWLRGAIDSAQRLDADKRLPTPLIPVIKTTRKEVIYP